MSSSSPSGGFPLRAVAMVLIALAIVFGGLGAFSISGSSSQSAQSATTTTTTTTSPTTTGVAASPRAVTPATSPTGVTAAAPQSVDKSVPVRVLNNSTRAGLATRTANQLREAGWTNVSAGNYSAGVLGSTTVYYGHSARDQAAAHAIASTLKAVAAPRFSGLGAGGSGVVVVVTSAQ